MYHFQNLRTMKKLTSNCDYPTLTLSVLWLVFDIVILLYYFATTEHIVWSGVCNALFWTAIPVVFVIGLYKEGTKKA